MSASVGILTDDYRPYEDGWGGTGWARIGKYLPHLGFRCDLAHQIWPSDDQGISITDSRGNRLWPDILWTQRVMMPRFHVEIISGRMLGQRVVTDIDDLMWELPKGSIADRVLSREQVEECAHTLSVSDHVTVSTEWLQMRIMNQLGVKSTVIKNTVDVIEFEQVDQWVDTPTIGWTGCPAVRPGDLEKMRDVLPHFTDRARIQHSGHIDGFPTFADKTLVEPDIVLNAVHASEFPSIVNFHIGLVPLTKHDFNRAKSDIKGIEYAAAGIPFVASPLPSYKRLQKDWGPVVRLANTTDEWIDHLNELMDPAIRAVEGSELRELAWSRDVKTAIRPITDALFRE